MKDVLQCFQRLLLQCWRIGTPLSIKIIRIACTYFVVKPLATCLQLLVGASAVGEIYAVVEDLANRRVVTASACFSPELCHQLRRWGNRVFLCHCKAGMVG